MSEPSPEEQERLAREVAEQLRRLRVEDVLVNTLMTVSSLGYRRLGATEETREDRDLDQARLAIETMRALTPVLERFLPGDVVRDFNSSVANLQLAYAKVSSEAGAAARETPPGDAEASDADASRGQSPGHGSEGPSEGAETSEADASGGQSPGRGRNRPGDGEAE